MENVGGVLPLLWSTRLGTGHVVAACEYGLESDPLELYD